MPSCEVECGMQALTHLDSYSQRGFEVVFGGDLNWIEEERGPMQLLPGWCDTALRRCILLQDRAELHVVPEFALPCRAMATWLSRNLAAIMCPV